MYFLIKSQKLRNVNFFFSCTKSYNFLDHFVAFTHFETPIQVCDLFLFTKGDSNFSIFGSTAFSASSFCMSGIVCPFTHSGSHPFTHTMLINLLKILATPVGHEKNLYRNKSKYLKTFQV